MVQICLRISLTLIPEFQLISYQLNELDQENTVQANFPKVLLEFPFILWSKNLSIYTNKQIEQNQQKNCLPLPKAVKQPSALYSFAPEVCPERESEQQQLYLLLEVLEGIKKRKLDTLILISRHPIKTLQRTYINTIIWKDLCNGKRN